MNRNPAWRACAALCLLVALTPPASAIEIQRSEGLNFSPPRIAVEHRPTRLLLVDGPPARVAIPGTGLEFVVNTDWSVFHAKTSGVWYILDDGHWLTSNFFSSGDWRRTTELHEDFLTLQVSSEWPEVAAAMPPVRAPESSAPLLISYEPTELVLIEGETQLAPIAGTGIEYVVNTRNDLFRLDDRWYLLVSGRWFHAREFKRQWYAVRDLPEAFAAIPADHDKAYVLASVPGTPAAEKAREAATRPSIKTLDRTAGAELKVPYVGEPNFVRIKGTELQRAENTPFPVIRHNNFYYLCHEAAWYASASPTGPWQAAIQVPEAIYTIPPTDPLYNVTFVRLDAFDDTSDQIAYRSTQAYYGKYWSGSTVVYGTGWYYPGYWNRSVYWRYPYTYGYPRAYWDPYWNYGYHYSATYKVNLREKDWEWSLDGSKRRVYDYGNRNYVGSGEYIMYDSKFYEGDGSRQ